MNCQHCQPLLLDHLYGLLDAPEAAAVDAHLASCPACAAARAETARVQGLIARAAKSAFPNVRFEAPVSTPAKATTRTSVPASAPALPFPANRGEQTDKEKSRTLRIGTIIPWAIAAAVLIAIPGTVIPVLGMFNRVESAKRNEETAKRDVDSAVRAVEVAKLSQNRRLADAELQLTAAEQTQTALLNKWVDEQKAALQAKENQKLKVEVFKPANVQPGAPNDFLVVIKDERDQWETRGGKMFAEIHAAGATDAVLFSQA